MELLDDVCHMESHFGLFRNSVSFGARYVHGLHLMQETILEAPDGTRSCRGSSGGSIWYVRI